ncbi:MAG: methylenetetrahydrofolate reductase [Xanthobacteraceae bacterium]
MQDRATQPAAGRAGAAPAADNIVRAVNGFSLEATFPDQAELDALKASIPASTHVYLSCPPNQLPERLVEYASAVRASGFEPVPHLTARAYIDAAHAGRVLARLNGEAGVTCALVIAGDRDAPVGMFAGALDLIESEVLQRNGIREIGISGYPDGHPKIDDATLARVLMQKLDAAARQNLAVHIATQFCFDAEPILNWLRWLRGEGVGVPVRIGVAGPTSMRALMRYALRCGVRASLKGMLNPKAMQLLGEAAPDGIIRALSEAEDSARLGPLAVHFFSFGGLAATAEWAMGAARGHVEFTPQGFRVLRKA